MYQQKTRKVNVTYLYVLEQSKWHTIKIDYIL